MRFPLNVVRGAPGPIIALAVMLALPAQASPVWTWSFTGAALDAGGTFSTAEAPNSAGYYLITALTGQRNGVAIIGLQPTGTAIPGNDGFPVDNLISGSGEQLTGNGFGFETADHAHSNPFFANFLAPVGYAEFYTFGTAGSMSTELPVTFSARLVSHVPEPSSLALLGNGLLALSWVLRRRWGPSPPRPCH